MENIKIGAFAPDFKALDINNQIVTLSQFKSKNIVILDFWASWCVPCRNSIPFLKNLYNKYNFDGLEIIAVSQDLDKDAWLSAIEQDSTESWYHIPIAEKYSQGPKYFTKEDIYSNYFIQAIPVTILINYDGKIIGRWMGESRENEEQLERKLKELAENKPEIK
jgi:peroxiredoxin